MIFGFLRFLILPIAYRQLLIAHCQLPIASPGLSRLALFHAVLLCPGVVRETPHSAVGPVPCPSCCAIIGAIQKSGPNLAFEACPHRDGREFGHQRADSVRIGSG